MAKAKTPAQLRKHISFLKKQIVTAEKSLKKAKTKTMKKKKPVKKKAAKKRTTRRKKR